MHHPTIIIIIITNPSTDPPHYQHTLQYYYWYLSIRLFIVSYRIFSSISLHVIPILFVFVFVFFFVQPYPSTRLFIVSYRIFFPFFTCRSCSCSSSSSYSYRYCYSYFELWNYSNHPYVLWLIFTTRQVIVITQRVRSTVSIRLFIVPRRNGAYPTTLSSSPQTYNVFHNDPVVSSFLLKYAPAL